MTELIVHIGYYKTGTTFLQNVVFPSMDLVWHDIEVSTRTLFNMVITDDIDYNEREASQALEKVVVPGKTNLFSLESLVGPMFMYAGINRSIIAERLKSLGFTKVIVSLRSQENIIDSYYRQYINVGGVLRFKDYLESDFFNAGFFHYDKLINKYEAIFGKENLHLILQESLVKRKSYEIDRLCVFLNSKYSPEKEKKGFSNVSMTNSSLGILRIANHFTANYFKPSNLISSRITTWKMRYFLQRIFDPYFVRYFSSKKSFTKGNEKVQHIVTSYRKGNSCLNQGYNLQMEQYNYPLEP